jgi:hypothetical protein
LRFVPETAEFIALSRTRQLSLASSGTGGLPHLIIESLIQATGSNIMHVPYKGDAPETDGRCSCLAVQASSPKLIRFVG